MSSQMRSPMMIIATIATVALGACTSDPTAVRPVTGKPTGPVEPFSVCVQQGLSRRPGDSLVAGHSIVAARQAGVEKLVACNTQ